MSVVVLTLPCGHKYIDLEILSETIKLSNLKHHVARCFVYSNQIITFMLDYFTTPEMNSKIKTMLQEIEIENFNNEQIKRICRICNMSFEQELINKICCACESKNMESFPRVESQLQDVSNSPMVDFETIIKPTLEEFEIILKRESNNKKFDSKIIQLALKLSERFLQYKQSLQMEDAAKFALDATMGEEEDLLTNEFRIFWEKQLQDARTLKNDANVLFVDLHTWSKQELDQLKIYMEQYEKKM